jgi:hypothetical protein
MQGIRSAAEAVRGHIDLRTALTDSGVPVEKKRDVLRDIFGDAVTLRGLSVVTLAVERGHAGALSVRSHASSARSPRPSEASSWPRSRPPCHSTSALRSSII